MSVIKIKTLIAGLIIGQFAFAQEVTLEQCIQWTTAHAPATGNIEHIVASSDLQLKNLQTNYYPQIKLTGQVTWQNDVPHVESALPGMQLPLAPKDQYKSYIDVSQLIYDGGMTKALKELEEAKKAKETSSVKVGVYQLNNQVIEAYFSVLILGEQMKQLAIIEEDLNNRLKDMQLAFDNGMVRSSELNVIKVELLKLKQSKTGLEQGRVMAVEILSELTGQAFTPETTFATYNDIALIQSNNRPELEQFRLEKLQLESANQVLKHSRYPVLAGFGQLGYGNPGYNMLLDSFEPFYMVGVRLSWSVTDWKQTARKQQVNKHLISMVDTKEAGFVQSINIAKSKYRAYVTQTEQMMQADDEIILLQKTVTEASRVQLKNGEIKATDYITDLNKESSYKLTKQIRSIELVKTNALLNNLLGGYANNQ